MATRQTFHTPSFGDEEFEILAAPTFDHHQQQTNVINPTTATTELSLLSPSTLSSSSLHSTVLPSVVTNQSANNQWHTQPIGVGENIPIIESDYTGNNRTIIMGDHHNIGVVNDEDDTVRFGSTTITIEDGTTMATSNTAAALAKIKKKRDPNEPPKPVSAYALFFRDTQAAIKGQNPDASFGEISKIVASMWDALDPEHKNVYKKKSELAKKEYLKSLAAYRASAVSKGEEIVTGGNVQENDIQIQSSNSALNSISGGEYVPTATASNTPTMIQTRPIETNTQSSIVNVVTISRTPPSLQNPTTTQCVPPSEIHVPVNHATQMMNNQPPYPMTEIPLQQQQQNNITAVTNNPANVIESSSNQPNQKCIRDGCNNKAIINPDWEDEYCSNECVIIHCRDVFSHWIQTNNNSVVTSESYPTA